VRAPGGVSSSNEGAMKKESLDAAAWLDSMLASGHAVLARHIQMQVRVPRRCTSLPFDAYID